MVILDYRPQHLLRTRAKIIRRFRRTRIQSRKAGVLVDRPNALLKLSVRYRFLRYFFHGLLEIDASDSSRRICLYCGYDDYARLGYLSTGGMIA